MFAPRAHLTHRAASVVATAGTVAGLTLASSSCAKHPAPNPDAVTHAVTIQVNNNVIPAFTFSIWVREGTGSGGSRRELGTAGPNQTTIFAFTPRMFGQQYTLEAVPPLGTTLRRSFSIDNESITMLRWALDQNVVSYFGTN